MTLQQLRCFISTAKCMSFRGAAQYMHISQPAVSNQIRLLEEEMGVKLFDRSQKQVALTSVGKTFFRDALEIINRVDIALQRARNEETREELNLYLDEFSRIPQVEEILKLYHKKRPETGVNITNDYLLTDSQVTGPTRVDVAICCENMFTGRSDVRMTTLTEDDICCVMNRSHPTAQKESMKKEELDGECLVFLDNNQCPPWQRQLNFQLLQKNPSSKLCYASDYSQIISLVTAGYGIALMPEFMIPENEELARIPLEDAMKIKLVAACKGDSDQKKVSTFIEIAKAVFDSRPVL